MSDEPTDHDLVAAANRGDAEALAALYRRHRDWVFALARRYCHEPADAEDVLQEVFRYFLARFPGFTLTCELRTFLFPVVRHKCLDLLRQQRRTAPLPDDVDTPAGPDPAAGGRAAADLVAALPDEQRDVLVLRFVEGLSLAEIAARLGIPVGTVKSRLHHGLARLRDQLG